MLFHFSISPLLKNGPFYGLNSIEYTLLRRSSTARSSAEDSLGSKMELRQAVDSHFTVSVFVFLMDQDLNILNKTWYRLSRSTTWTFVEDFNVHRNLAEKNFQQSRIFVPKAFFRGQKSVGKPKTTSYVGKSGFLRLNWFQFTALYKAQCTGSFRTLNYDSIHQLSE